MRLTRATSVRHGRLTVTISKKLPAGAYFIVVCPVTGRGRCAASKTQMAKTPTTSTLPQPVNATPVAETAQAKSASIGSAGGTLTATAADGTTFTLTLPAQSVPDGTEVTMTPVSSLGHARGVGSLIAGVQLEPEGLELYHGGTLTIVPKHPVSPADQTAYSYTADGADIHQVVMLPTNAIEIPLAHFSGWDVVKPLPPGAQPSPTGSTILDFYTQLISEDLAAVRSGQESEQAGYDMARGWLQDAYNDVMREEVPPGLSDDNAAHQAIRDLLTIARTNQIINGGDDSTFQAEKPTILKLLAGVWNRAQQDCVSSHNLQDVSKIIAVDRNEELISGSADDIPADLSCLRFEVDFDSRVTINAGSGGSGSWLYQYTATATITPDASEGFQFLDGSGTGSYPTATGTISGDGVNTTLQSGTGAAFKVDKFTIPDDPDDHSPPEIVLEVGNPLETYLVDDTGTGFTDTYTDSQWLNVFNQFNPPQGSTHDFILENNGANATVATGTFSGTSPDGSAQEVTSIDIVHTPPPAPQQ